MDSINSFSLIKRDKCSFHSSSPPCRPYFLCKFRLGKAVFKIFHCPFLQMEQQLHTCLFPIYKAFDLNIRGFSQHKNISDHKKSNSSNVKPLVFSKVRFLSVPVKVLHSITLYKMSAFVNDILVSHRKKVVKMGNKRYVVLYYMCTYYSGVLYEGFGVKH